MSDFNCSSTLTILMFKKLILHIEIVYKHFRPERTFYELQLINYRDLQNSGRQRDKNYCLKIIFLPVEISVK